MSAQISLCVLLFPSNLFFMKASKDFSDGHLWYSVISRPPSSTFTCVQRASCCFSLLLCTMLTSIMFYGIPSDPSEQTMDLGTAFIHYILFLVRKWSNVILIFEPFFTIQSKELNSFCQAFLKLCVMNTIRLLLILGNGQNDLPFFLLFTGHFEFTWQQFMIGVQSSLIMFPINILIVSIFRHTRHREPCCCKSKRDSSNKAGRTSFSLADTQAVNDIATLETVMKVCVLLFYRGECKIFYPIVLSGDSWKQHMP